jgi:predicted permease
VQTLWLDFRYGLRMLRKVPLFAALATLTLAVGIGATTAMFSVINAVLLRAAPYRHPAQLVKISARNAEGDEELVTAGDFSHWKAETKGFEDLASYKSLEFRALTGQGDPDEVWAPEVSTNVFQVLGVNPAYGRTFAPNETQAIVLSYGYWRSHFSADPKILGRTLALDGKPYTIIGVASADLEFPQANTQMWVPLTFSAADKDDHDDGSLDVIARLKAGVSLEQAQAEMSVTASRLALQFPKTNAARRALVKPYKDREISDTLRSAIYALLAAVVLVFAIVCANTIGMLLARGSTRQAEMAIRSALGAGRLRLVRQLVAESVLLSAAAGVVGLVLAWCGLTLIVGLVPKQNLVETQALHRITLNLPALGFTVAWAFLTGIVVGLLPAVRVSSLNINESLKEHARASATGTKGPRLRRILVACEVAIALILLVGAGLLIQSSARLEIAPTGFKPDHLLTVRVPLVNYKYAQGERSAAFYRTVLERIEAIPGVTSAAMANNLPFTGFHTSLNLPVSPNSPGTSDSSRYVAERSISPGYFRAMGIPMKSGREFTEFDNQNDARCVLIVNETMARHYWPGENPVGKLLPNACPKNASALVVGMVADSKQVSVDAPANPEVYSPYAQFPFASFLVTFVVRTSSNPSDLAAAVRSVVWDVDHDQPVIQVRTMENVIGESIWPYHVSASMVMIFAAIALVLASVGIYAMLAYSVSQRTHEIGIRLALGARREDVLRLVIGEGFVLALVGLVAGTMGAIGLTRFLKSLLYGVGPSDLRTYIAATLILVVVALLACYIPARRAIRVDPMVALRYQ